MPFSRKDLTMERLIGLSAGFLAGFFTISGPQSLLSALRLLSHLMLF